MPTLEEQLQTLATQLTDTTPATLPAMPRQSADDGGGGGWTGLLGDVGEVLSGGQSPTYRLRGSERAAAGSRALLNFGINMLMASGPQRVRPDLGSIFGAGLQGAQQSMDLDQRRAAAVAAQDYTQRMELAKLGVEQSRDKIERAKAALSLLTLQQQEKQRAAVLGGGDTTATGRGGGPDGGYGDQLTGDMAHDEPIIRQRESGGKPDALNYVARSDPSMRAQGATASGLYGMTDTTWKEGLQMVGGDAGKYPTAQSAPESVQRQVFQAVYKARGTAPWDSRTWGQNWVQGSDGKYQLVKTGAPAPGSRPAASTAATAPPGVQMGGPPPAPPGSRDTGAYAGGGIGSVLNPDVAKTSPTLRGPGSPDPGRRADVEAIQSGIALAQATPLVPGTGQEAGPSSAVAQTRPGFVPGQPDQGFGSGVGTYGNGKPPAATTSATTPAPPDTLPAPNRPHPFKPDLSVPPDDPRFSTVLPQSVEEDFRRRLQLNESQLRTRVATAPAADIDKIVGEHDKIKQEILKDRTAALSNVIKEQGGAVGGWQKEERERQFQQWKDQRYPAEPSDLAAAKITPQPGVIYQVDNQGNVTQQKVEVDPRLQRQAEDDYKAFQTGYQAPYVQLQKVRPIMDQMDALRQQIIRNGGAASGIAGDKLRMIQQAAGALGIATDNFGNLNDVQVLESLANQVVLAMKQGVALGNTSNMDLQIVGSQVPTMMQTLSGQEKLSAVLRQIWDHQERVYKIANKEIRSPGTGYTFRDLDERLAEAGPAIPMLPEGYDKWDRKQFEEWRGQHKLRKGQVYYMPDGTIATVTK